MQDSIDDFLQFINGRILFHDRRSSSLVEVNSRASDLHKQTSNKHKEIIEWFKKYQQDPPLTRQKVDDLFSIDLLDIESLDEEVREELNLTDSDVHDAQILELLGIAGRPLDLNQIIVGASRKYDVKHKRNQLTARIHRLVGKGEVKVVGKGLYQLITDIASPSQDQSATLDDLLS